MNLNRRSIIDILFWIFFASLLCVYMMSIVLPKGSLPHPRYFLYAATVTLIFRGIWMWLLHRPDRSPMILLFLLMFLFSAIRVSRIDEYSWGVDDSYYYSYVASLVIDGDLEISNQTARTGLDRFLSEKQLVRKTGAGYSENIYPIGCSMFWMPFFIAGHGLARLYHLPTDGYSRPYTHSVLLGNLFYTYAGLYFCWLFARRFFSPLVAGVGTLALAVTTPYLVLNLQSFLLVSEPLSMAAGAALLCLIGYREEFGDRPGFLFACGILLGALSTIRLQNAVFVVAPVVLLLARARNSGAPVRTLFLGTAALAAGSLLGFLPQWIVWKILYARWIPSMGSLVSWESPAVLESLFSSRKGLFPWQPPLIACMVGLLFLLKKAKRWGAAALLMLLLSVCLNAIQNDWWGSVSLGARRFLPLAPVFAATLAAFFSAFSRQWRYAAVLSVLLFAPGTLYQAKSFEHGILQKEHADRFKDMFEGAYTPYRWIGYAMQFPVQLSYVLHYGIPFYGEMNEWMIGEDIFYFQDRSGSSMLDPNSPIFGRGWSFRSGQRIADRSSCDLYIPMFVKDKPRTIVRMDIKPLQGIPNLWIDFSCNDQFLRAEKVPEEGAVLSLLLGPRMYHRGINTLSLRIYVRHSVQEPPELVLKSLHFSRQTLSGLLPAES